MAMQADTTDNKLRMRVKVTVFQGRQSDAPCNKYVSVELLNVSDCSRFGSLHCVSPIPTS